MAPVTLSRVLFLALLLFFCVVTVSAQTPDLTGFEPVLVPIIGVRGGAYGATFSSSFGAVGPGGFQYYAGGETLQSYDGLGQLRFTTIEGPPSRVAWIDSSVADRVWFRGSLVSSDAEKLHDSESLLPVVRTDDFVRGKSILFSIGSGEGTRKHIRLYTFSPDPQTFTVRACINNLGMFENSCTGDAITLVALPPADGDVTVPSYAQADLSSIVRCVVISPHSGCVEFSYRIVVEAQDPELPYYAMVSTTDNATQRVSVFVPQ